LARSPVDIAGGQAAETFAGRAIAAGRVVLVPVIESRARIGGGGQGARETLGGSSAVEFIGAWIEEPSHPPRWLAVRESPPEPESDWESWLVARPHLMDEIARALAHQGE
jgi:hypothetical protein